MSIRCPLEVRCVKMLLYFVLVKFMYVLYNMTGMLIVNCGIGYIIYVRNSVASGLRQNNKFS